MLAGLAALAAAGLWQRSGPGPAGLTVEGRATVVDGDSLRVAGREIRLLGVDAPEGHQTCMRNDRSYPCGDEARDHLRTLVAGSAVTCRGERADQHDRVLAVCYSGGGDLNAAMVRSGWAVAFGRYQAEEAEARAARSGLWAGTFERPQDWRRSNGTGG